MRLTRTPAAGTIGDCGKERAAGGGAEGSLLRGSHLNAVVGAKLSDSAVDGYQTS